MKKGLRNLMVAICIITSVMITSVGVSAMITYPTNNDVWDYGTKKIGSTKFTYSDYLNYNGVNWYTASVTDKSGNLLARDKKTDGVKHAYALAKKKSGNQVYYNYN